MQGLIRATYYHNKVQAISDWQKVCEFAIAHDCADILPANFNPHNVGVKRIDAEIAKVRRALKREKGVSMPLVHEIGAPLLEMRKKAETPQPARTPGLGAFKDPAELTGLTIRGKGRRR